MISKGIHGNSDHRRQYAMLARGLHGLDRDIRSGFGQGAKYSAGMKPARPQRAENGIPVDLSGCQRQNRGVAAIGTSESGADSKTAFGEVQAVADRSANAVIIHPADQ